VYFSKSVADRQTTTMVLASDLPMKVQIVERKPVDNDADFMNVDSIVGKEKLSSERWAEENDCLAAENVFLYDNVCASWDTLSWHQWDQQFYASMSATWPTQWEQHAAEALHSDVIKFPEASYASTYSGYSPSNSFIDASNVMLTSVMMRNIPNNYTRTMLLDLLESEGFGSTFDFFYLPVDLKKKSGLGYAFINFVHQDVAEAFCQHFSGFRRWAATSQKICQVTWSDYIQGFASHVERYRNSAIMHESVPEEFKPMVFMDGVQIPFPPPTKAIPEPQDRQTRDK
jgi:hypothetical protein